MKIYNIIIAFFCGVGINFLYSCKTIKPNLPTTPTLQVPSIPQPLSEIDIPITVGLNNYILQADAQVPKTFNGSENPCEGLRYHYEGSRTPINFTGAGNQITLKTIGSYGLGAEYCAKCFFGNCVVPKPSGSCGEGGEAQRRVEVGFTSTINILSNYKLQTNTKLSTLNPIDRCKVTLVDIDVTGKIMGIIGNILNKITNELDSRVGAIDERPKLQTMWDKVSNSISISDYGFLFLNPQDLRLSALNMSGATLNFSVGMSSKPFFSTISTPIPPKPLPDLSSYTPGNGFNIYLDINADYDELSKKLDGIVKGKKITIKTKFFKKSIIITRTSVWGIGNQKIVIAIDFKGWRKGTIYLTGTPNYNNISNELSFPDLNFDLATKSALLKTAKWLFNGKISDYLKNNAKYNFSKLIMDNKAKLQSNLNRNISPNIKLNGNINDLNIQNIYPTRSNLLLRTICNGKLEIQIQ